MTFSKYNCVNDYVYQDKAYREKLKLKETNNKHNTFQYSRQEKIKFLQ